MKLSNPTTMFQKQNHILIISSFAVDDYNMDLENNVKVSIVF